jgi:YbbR domain-containing protein
MNSERATLILAIGIALFLWIYVRMVQDAPEGARTLREVAVILDGTPAPGLVARLHEKNRTLDVAVRGIRDRVAGLGPGEVKVRVDVSGITDAKTQTLPARVSLPEGVRLAGDTPRVTVIVTTLERKTFSIQIAFITAPPTGTTVGEYRLEPETVAVDGTKEALAQVRAVVLPIDPAEEMTHFQDVAPRPVDEHGERIPDVRVLTPTVRVRTGSITGPPPTRQLAVHPPLLQNVPARTLVVPRLRPDSVTVHGDAILFNGLPAYLECEPINVAGIRQSRSVTARLKVPRGLTVVDGPTVHVDLNVHMVP